MTMPKETMYSVEVSAPYTQHVEVQPNYYAKRTFVDVVVPNAGFRATLELQSDDKLKEAIKQKLGSYLAVNTARVIQIAIVTQPTIEEA